MVIENKKVLHVVNISFVLPYYIGEQFDYFSAKGLKFYVACQPSAHLFQYAETKGFKAVPVNIVRKISIYEDLKAIYTLVKLIKSEKIDIVIGHTPKGGLVGMMAGYVAGVKTRVYYRHGLMFETSKGIKRVILKGIERFTGYLATKVVCVSPSVLAYSNEEKLSAVQKNLILNKGTCNGIDARIRFSPDHMDIDQLEKRRLQYGISPKDKVVGFVGRLVNDKGISELLKAWDKLIKSHDNIKLLLVGPLEERDELPGAAKEYIKRTASIIHTGLIEDIAPFYALMNIFILPSYREGFPTVVLEASAMGLPVLTTKVTGCKDAILENETGMFIGHHPEGICEKINFYLNNPKTAIEHGKNGRAFVLDNFDQLKIWQEIETKVFE